MAVPTKGELVPSATGVVCRVVKKWVGLPLVAVVMAVGSCGHSDPTPKALAADKIHAACGGFRHAFERASDEAERTNNAVDQLTMAHPYGIQDAWSSQDLNDLKDGARLAAQAASIDRRWGGASAVFTAAAFSLDPINATVDMATTGIDTSRVGRGEALSLVEGECTGR